MHYRINREVTVKNELCVYLYKLFKIVKIDFLNVIIVTTKILHFNKHIILIKLISKKMITIRWRKICIGNLI